MPYPTTPTGMRALAGDYRDADVRWAQARRSAKVAKATEAAESYAPTRDAALPGSTTRFARLLTLIPRAR